MAAARTVWFSFHLGCHRSAVSLSALNVSPLTQTIALMWGSGPCFSSPTPRAGPALLRLLFFPLVPLSYWVLCGSMYSFPLLRSSCPLSAGVLHALLSEGVFLMYLWREMYSTSTYSSAILFFYSLLLSKLCILNDSDLTSRGLNKANLTLNLPYFYLFITLNNFTLFSRVWSLYL